MPAAATDHFDYYCVVFCNADECRNYVKFRIVIFTSLCCIVRRNLMSRFIVECEISDDIRVRSVIPSFSVRTDIVILAVEFRACDSNGQAPLRLPLLGYLTLCDINDS